MLTAGVLVTAWIIALGSELCLINQVRVTLEVEP